MSALEERDVIPRSVPPTREHLLHMLYEAAELEHNLMCTYLYAALSLRDGQDEGLGPEQAQAVARWKHTILHVAIEEMGHLAAVWNLTPALGGAPRAASPLLPGASAHAFIVERLTELAAVAHTPAQAGSDRLVVVPRRRSRSATDRITRLASPRHVRTGFRSDV